MGEWIFPRQSLCGGIDSVRLMVVLDDLEGLLLPKQFYDSMTEFTDSLNFSMSPLFFALPIFGLSADLIFQQRQTFHSHIHDTYLFLKCC